MASELKVDTIKHTNNTSAITLDTSGNVTLAGSANNLGTVSAGTFNGTVGSSATLPSKATDYTHFYHARRAGVAMANFGEYATANNTENTYAYMTGVAPTSFTTIVNMYWWFIAENGGTRTYQAELAWQISSNSQNMNAHNLSNTRLFQNLDLVEFEMARINMMSIGSSGSRFEDLVADGDAFGLRVYHDVNAAVRPLGASITWRF